MVSGRRLENTGELSGAYYDDGACCQVFAWLLSSVNK